MVARWAPIARLSGVKSLIGVAVVGAFFIVFALAGGAGLRPSRPPAEAPRLEALRELRARLADAVARLQDPDAAARGRAVRDVLRIAREELPPAVGNAEEALAEQADGLAALARDPASAGGPFARKAERLLGFVDACLELADAPAAR